MTIQNQFVGTWRLVSWENRDDSGNVSYPFGRDAVGCLIYTEDGYMSGTLMKAKANRPNFTSQDILGGSTEEQASAVQSYIAYCGKYEIQSNKVIHHIEVSLFPNWVGINQERFFEFQGNQLSLSTPSLLMNGKQQRGYLIWERASRPKKTVVEMLCDALKGV